LVEVAPPKGPVVAAANPFTGIVSDKMLEVNVLSPGNLLAC